MHLPHSVNRTIVTLFMVALALRWSYAFIMFLWMGDAALLGVDSGEYIASGQSIASGIMAGTLHGWDLFGPNPFMMPLFRWLIAIDALITNDHTAFAYILTQGLFDSGTCLLVYGMAGVIDPRLARPAAIAAALNPTQIVMAGLAYPDTPFVFFVALMLYGALRWLRSPSWPAMAIITIGLVCAAWIRILVVPFSLVLFIFLPAVMMASGRIERRQLVQIGAMLATFAILLFPISLQNKMKYDSWAFTPQGGTHLARWVVPLTWEVRDGTPWVRGFEEMERRAALLPKPPDENSFQESRRYTTVAIEELIRIGPVGIARSWAFGAAINLGTPGIVLSPPVSKLPRTGFYGTAGATIFGKIANFLFHSDNALYGWILLIGSAGVTIMRLLQLGGLSTLIGQRQWAPALLLVGWCVFILGVNGPVASPKYRLPMEPVLAVLTGAGWSVLFRRRAGKEAA